MALLRRKSPEIVRKSSDEGTLERKTLRVKGEKVEVTRLEARPATTKPKKEKRRQPSRSGSAQERAEHISHQGESPP